MPAFTEENIALIFGHEAAENEDLSRLKEYYFKSQIFQKVTAELPLRILVGHKGIGKSALFKIALDEDIEAGRLAIALKPDDVSGIANSSKEFNVQIREWKDGIFAVIQQILLDKIGLGETEISRRSGKFFSWLKKTAKPYIEGKVDLDVTEEWIVSRFLSAKEVIVYIDDLDRGWQGRAVDIHRISALLNALRDISSSNEGIKFRVALRTDVYFAVRTSDESTDKIESSVIWYSWTTQEILALLAKRVLTFLGKEADQERLVKLPQITISQYFSPIMTGRFMGKGKWANIPIHQMLATMIRKRPRDLVKLCTLAARSAHDRRAEIISTDDFRSNFENYSQGRIQDAINEHRSELPDIERLLMGMKPERQSKRTLDQYSFKTDRLLAKLNNISSQGKFQWANKATADAKGLAAFLYKIDFLIARKTLDSGEIERRYFEENRYLSSTFVDFGFDWEIHPAYRWTLQPDSIDKLYEDIRPFTD